MTDSLVQSLVRVSRDIGREDRDLVLLAEGNTSVRFGDDAMLVKVSGAMLASATITDFVEVDRSALIRLVDATDVVSDATVAETLRRAARLSRRPSVESLLHAVCYEEAEVGAVIHTHPIAINMFLCSDRAEMLTTNSLFPDQVVVLGRANLLVPYVDPGLPLAREVRRRFRGHRAEHGCYPRVIYLKNHGIFALGATLADALAVTVMATKSAQVLHGAMLAGSVVPLSARDVDRIDSRPDELLRRGQLREHPDEGTGAV